MQPRTLREYTSRSVLPSPLYWRVLHLRCGHTSGPRNDTIAHCWVAVQRSHSQTLQAKPAHGQPLYTAALQSFP